MAFPQRRDPVSDHDANGRQHVPVILRVLGIDRVGSVGRRMEVLALVV